MRFSRSPGSLVYAPSSSGDWTRSGGPPGSELGTGEPHTVLGPTDGATGAVSQHAEASLGGLAAMDLRLTGQRSAHPPCRLRKTQRRLKTQPDSLVASSGGP